MQASHRMSRRLPSTNPVGSQKHDFELGVRQTHLRIFLTSSESLTVLIDGGRKRARDRKRARGKAQAVHGKHSTVFISHAFGKKPEVERERRSDERGRRSAAVREELSEAQSKPTQDERWGKEKGVQEREWK